jgi:hypothetical protein
MGFKISEIMSGFHEFHDGRATGRHPFEFKATWGPDRILDWLDPRSPAFLWQELEGTVRAGGLTDGAPCKGTLHLEYIPKRSIRYDFDFDVDGVTYHYVGEKQNILPWNVWVTHTTCFGVLTERSTGKLVSTGVTFFRLRDLPGFLNVRTT